MKQTKTHEINDYINACPIEKKDVLEAIRQAIKESLPTGFEETFQYQMIGYVVPLKTYPKGYHANPKEPLPFMHLGYQKHHVALYYMGFYLDDVRTWFIKSYIDIFGKKPDLGKSCLRFKEVTIDSIDLIKALLKKVDLKMYLELISSIDPRSQNK